MLAGTNVTGVAGGSYSVLSSTNVAAALSNWSVVTNDHFGAGGSFSNVIPASNSGLLFLLIKTP